MTFEIALVLGILLAAIVLFVTEWIRMDLVALLVLVAVALTGLVTPAEAFTGFSNPAVVPEADTAVGPHAHHLLPVAGEIPEAFTALVYPVACELLAAHLAEVVGEPFFRGFAGPYEEAQGGNTIRQSAVLESLDGLG